MLAEIASWENLLLAFHRASAGKRGRPEVAAFEHHLEDNLVALRRDLLDQSYRPGPYASFYISRQAQAQTAQGGAVPAQAAGLAAAA